MGARILASIILFISIVFLPFYVSVPIAILGIIFFSNFLEAPILFFLLEILYGVRDFDLNGLIFKPFFIFIILVVVIEMAKKKIRFYH